MVGYACIRVGRVMVAVLWPVQRRMLPEQERNAPNCRNGYQTKYNAADNRALSSEKEADNVKLKNADRTPVDSADNQQNQHNAVYDKHLLTPFFYVG